MGFFTAPAGKCGSLDVGVREKSPQVIPKAHFSFLSMVASLSSLNKGRKRGKMADVLLQTLAKRQPRSASDGRNAVDPEKIHVQMGFFFPLAPVKCFSMKLGSDSGKWGGWNPGGQLPEQQHPPTSVSVL